MKLITLRLIILKSVDLKELLDSLKTKILKKSCKKRYAAVAVESFQCLANLLWLKLKPCMILRLLIIQLAKARLLLVEDGFKSSWSVWIIFQLHSIIISFLIHGFWLTEYLHVKDYTEFSLYVLIFLCQKYLK